MAQEGEPLISFIYVNLSAKDRQRLEEMADERGATLSGVVRKLIRDAAPGAPQFGQELSSGEQRYASTAR